LSEEVENVLLLLGDRLYDIEKQNGSTVMDKVPLDICM
jgi:hypothetical protein